MSAHSEEYGKSSVRDCIIAIYMCMWVFLLSGLYISTSFGLHPCVMYMYILHSLLNGCVYTLGVDVYTEVQVYVYVFFEI